MGWRSILPKPGETTSRARTHAPEHSPALLLATIDPSPNATHRYEPAACSHPSVLIMPFRPHSSPSYMRGLAL